MKRVEKKAESLEKSGAKAKKTVSAKISSPEKPAPAPKKTVAAAKKPGRPAKAGSAEKTSVPASKAKRAVAAKFSEPAKPAAALKKKAAAAGEKTVKKSKPAAPAKIPAAKPQDKKTVAANSTGPKQKKEKRVQPNFNKAANLKNAPDLPKTSEKKVKTTAKRNEIVVPPIIQKTPKSAAPSEKKFEKRTGQSKAKKFEIVIPPITAKPVKKKIKPLGSAVVRGKNGKYDFEVYSLDAELKDGSAIYVISKRITDKRGRGHHKFVCIGQTESLLGDLKKHAKGKCIKQHKANVICLLREENETNRLKIETDLRAAHAIACNQK